MAREVSILTVSELKEKYGLNIKQALFVTEYMVDKNATQAYKRAGYSPKDDESAKQLGCRMLTNVNVSRALADWEQTLTAVCGWTPERIIETAAQVIEKSMQAVPVEEWDSHLKEKVATGEYVYDSKGAVAALALIAKLTGAEKQAIQNINVNLTGGLSIKLRRNK